MRIEDNAEMNKDTDVPVQNSLGTETILVVEDDTSVLEMTMSILSRQGYRVLSASKAAEAIQRATTYHKIPSTCSLPTSSCRELCAQIADRFPEMKVIYMSGYTHNVIAHHGILDQGIKFIQKPFSLKSLITKVRQALDAQDP